MTALQQAAQALPATILLWKSAPSAQAAAAIRRQTGLESVVFSSCEQSQGPSSASGASGSADYPAVMRGNVERLDRALGGG